MILAGDVGGTKTNLGLFSHEEGQLHLVAEKSFPSRQSSAFEGIVQEFMAGRGEMINSATFGIACPVVEGRCEATNLPWIVTTSGLKQKFGFTHINIINDLVAAAHGIPALKREAFFPLNEGVEDPEGPGGLLAPGTGLGETAFLRRNGGIRAWPSEGGHKDFAPKTKIEVELLTFLWKEMRHVSYERVLSGPGLVNIYRFLRDGKGMEEPPWLAERLQEGDPPAVISKAALMEEAEICVQALDMFVSILGAESGNLAMTLMATGGIYIGGGIAPKIIPKLKDRTFMDFYSDKGRMSAAIETMPVRVILEPKTALWGAAKHALSVL